MQSAQCCEVIFRGDSRRYCICLLCKETGHEKDYEKNSCCSYLCVHHEQPAVRLMKTVRAAQDRTDGTATLTAGALT